MKISNSKKKLAKIISANGGWRDGAEWSIQDRDKKVEFMTSRPEYMKSSGYWRAPASRIGAFKLDKLLPNWHQTILSRAEYFHLYPAPDADWWIEWNGGECPVGEEQLVRIKVRGETGTARGKAGHWSWGHSGCGSDIIAYRLHKPEQVKPRFCESVMRSIPEPEAKPTIEQLAADYRNAKDYADRKQQEADAANAEAKAKLTELVAAGNAIGLVINVAEKEPELVITDWRDLMIGDIIEYVDGDIKDKIGMSGPIVEFAPDATDGMHVRLKCDNGPHKGRLGWPRKWRFIRRPAK